MTFSAQKRSNILNITYRTGRLVNKLCVISSEAAIKDDIELLGFRRCTENLIIGCTQYHVEIT